MTVPWHLTTLEFQRKLKDHLAPDGAMLVNIIDDYVRGGRFLGAYIETARRVFKHVVVFCSTQQAWWTGG